MSNRNERIERAVEISSQHPTWGRPRINAELKKEYGHGLRNEELAGILRKQPERQAVNPLAKEMRLSQLFTSSPGLSQNAANRIIKKEFGSGTSYYKVHQAKTASQMTLDMLERLVQFQEQKNAPKIRIKVTERVNPMVQGQQLPAISNADYYTRANYLVRMGFFKHEYMWLAYHDLKSPAMARMIAERAALTREMKDKKLNEMQRLAYILQKYKANDWFFKDGRFNPFKVLESYYRKNRDGVPSDVTPKHKRRGAYGTDFMAAKKKTPPRRKRENFKDFV